MNTVRDISGPLSTLAIGAAANVLAPALSGIRGVVSGAVDFGAASADATCIIEGILSAQPDESSLLAFLDNVRVFRPRAKGRGNYVRVEWVASHPMPNIVEWIALGTGHPRPTTGRQSSYPPMSERPPFAPAQVNESAVSLAEDSALLGSCIGNVTAALNASEAIADLLGGNLSKLSVLVTTLNDTLDVLVPPLVYFAGNVSLLTDQSNGLPAAYGAARNVSAFLPSQEVALVSAVGTPSLSELLFGLYDGNQGAASRTGLRAALSSLHTNLSMVSCKTSKRYAD